MTLSIQELTEQFTRLLALDARPSAAAADPGAGNGTPAAVPPQPAIEPVDYPARGYHLEVRVLPDQVVSAARLLDQNGFTLDTITGIDWIAEGQMEVVYDYFHTAFFQRVAVRARIPRDNPEIPTISALFPGANWHERETHDFFGIRFLGHPNLEPLLLPEDADYHPLRKDFAA
jgi:NADH-quinone oxidoreductase subunit C